MACSKKYPCTQEECGFCCWVGRFTDICQAYNLTDVWQVVRFIIFTSVIFCLTIVSPIENEVQKFPAVTVELSPVPASPSGFVLCILDVCCQMYKCFYNCYTFLIEWPFKKIIIKCPSLSLGTVFNLKDYLSDITLTLLWLPYVWNNFFIPYNHFASLNLMCVFCRQLIIGSWLLSF